jgi:hypothetical protein
MTLRSNDQACSDTEVKEDEKNQQQGERAYDFMRSGSGRPVFLHL